MNAYSKTLIVILFTIGHLSVFAQSDFRPGYIIKVNGDSVMGEIKYQLKKVNAKECIFRNDSESTPENYSPQDLFAYRFLDNSYYVSSKFLDNQFKEEIFLEYIIEGELSIFYHDDGLNENYYLSKDSLFIPLDHPVQVARNAPTSKKPALFRGQIKSILSDQPSLFNQIDRLNYHEKDLITLTKKYQQLSCPNTECIVFEKKNQGQFAIGIGPTLGFGLSYLKAPPYNSNLSFYEPTKNMHFDQTTSLEAGILFELYLNSKSKNNIRILIGPSINVTNYHSNATRVISSLVHETDVNVKYVVMKLPFMLKYAFFSSNKAVAPFLVAGVEYQKYFENEGTFTYISYREGNERNLLLEYQSNPIPDYPFKPFYCKFGGGLDIKTGNSKIMVAAFYAQGESQIRSRRSDLIMQVGFQF